MTRRFSPDELQDITSRTLNHYEANAADFWVGTRDHDVTQNYHALLGAIAEATENAAGFKILDFGCGPGRDLHFFKSLGHEPIGLDGSPAFCAMARTHSGCEVWHQDFLKLELPAAHFDGVFANASLFHVPSQELVRVLSELRETLKVGGILFSSSPRGNAEGWSADRFGHYIEWEVYAQILETASLTPLSHYYRPEGLPRSQQPWLATVSRRS